MCWFPSLTAKGYNVIYIVNKPLYPLSLTRSSGKLLLLQFFRQDSRRSHCCLINFYSVDFTIGVLFRRCSPGPPQNYRKIQLICTSPSVRNFVPVYVKLSSEVIWFLCFVATCLRSTQVNTSIVITSEGIQNSTHNIAGITSIINL